MNSYKKIVLKTEEALRYIITDVLDPVATMGIYSRDVTPPVFSGKMLAKLILDLVNLKQGAVYTFLPENVSPEQIYQFKEGGMIPLSDEDRANITPIGRVPTPEGYEGGVLVPTPDNYELLFPIINDYLKMDTKNICIFIAAMQESNHLYMRPENTNLFTFKNNVYWYVASTEASIQKIEEMQRKSSNAWIQVFGVLTRSDKVEVPPFNKREITLEELETLAKNTSKIAVGAYDGEGFLIWSRSGDNHLP